MKKAILIAVAALICVALFVSCSSTDTTTASASASASTSASASESPSGESTTIAVQDEGASGDNVTEAQERLKALGYLDEVTGYYGEETKSAVEAFQTNNGLTVDGELGDQTLAKLMATDAVAAS